MARMERVEDQCRLTMRATRPNQRFQSDGPAVPMLRASARYHAISIY